MKQLFIIFSFFVAFCVSGQRPYGYSIEGEDVVFTCNLKDYKIAVIDNTDVQLDIEDININTVSLSGTFNEWKVQGWKLKKISQYVYELRKPVKYLAAETSAAFKYVINDRYWLIPPDFATNTSPLELNLLLENVYDLTQSKACIDEKGHVFTLYGFENADQVILTGSFNFWDESSFKMRKVNGHWELPLQLKTGVHEYKFIVDGRWMEDPMAQDRVMNEFGEYNSLVSQLKTHLFRLKDEGYKDVYLAGTFSNWQHDKLKMKHNEGFWEFSVALSYGVHQYKFIVDDSWIIDPVNETTQYGGEDQLNSVIFID